MGIYESVKLLKTMWMFKGRKNTYISCYYSGGFFIKDPSVGGGEHWGGGCTSTHCDIFLFSAIN